MATNSSGEFTFEDSSPDSLDEFQRSLIEDLKAFHVKHVDKVQKGFLQLLELGKHSDVTFIVTEDEQDHRIPAHRVILASQSEYFDRLLFGEMMEAHPGAEIPLQDTPLEAFQLLMKYTYCGEITIKDSDLQLVFDVIRLADRFGFHFLKSALDLFQLEKASASCLHFLDTHAQLILKDASQDFLSLPQKYLEDIICRDSFVCEEIHVFEIVRKWLEHNNKTKEESASLLRVVRLCEIPPKLLFAAVEPSGLFDKEKIFEAVKVSCKPELEHMSPRGFTAPDQNLFNSEGHLSKYQYHYNVSPPNWKETGRVSTSFNHLHSLQPSGSGSSSYKVPTSIVIDLSRVYLVNNIALELVKSRSDYTIYVSRDNKTWRPLIDYSTIKTICTGVQALWFPKQAVRYLQFVPSQKCTVLLHACELVSDVPLFAIRDPGVIVTQSKKCLPTSIFPPLVMEAQTPLEAFTPLHLYKSANTSSDDMAGYVVTFNQPFSISLLRMALIRDFVEGESIDVRVIVQGQVYDFKDKEFSEDIEVKFAERFVRRFTVLAKPTEEQTKKKRKLNDSNEWEMAKPSADIGQFKINFICQAL